MKEHKSASMTEGNSYCSRVVPDSAVGIPKPMNGRVGADAEQTSDSLGIARRQEHTHSAVLAHRTRFAYLLAIPSGAPKLPVIVAGSDDYVVEPVVRTEVVARVGSLIRRLGPNSS